MDRGSRRPANRKEEPVSKRRKRSPLIPPYLEGEAAEPPTMRQRRRRRRRELQIRRILLLAGVLAVAIIVGLSLLGSRNRPKEGEATIRIDPGTSTAQIARMLADQNIIDDEKDFMKQAQSSGAAEDLKAGTYTIARGDSIGDIIDMLRNGRQDPQSVLIVPEGNSMAEIASQLAVKTGISATDYLKAARARTDLPLEGAGAAPSPEGFLFPSTYNLDPGITADDIVSHQLQAFHDEAAPLFASAAPSAATQSLSQYQILIIASMIEREAKAPEERPLIAAVIYNRIAAGMKLEVDATVQYALGYWKPDLTAEDLAIDSPYNTRLYPGLPPGPICNPGLDSIRAALAPAPVDYLYYVAKGDGDGHHTFTRTYEEFLQAGGGQG